MNDEKIAPSLVRLKRVSYFVEKETKYREKLGTETQPFVKGDESIPFLSSIWTIASTILAAGADPCSMDKKQIFSWADHVLLGAPIPAVQAAEPQVEATSAQPKGAEVETGPVATEDLAPLTTTGIPVRLGIYTMLLSAHEISRLDRKPKAEEFRKEIERIARLYHENF